MEQQPTPDAQSRWYEEYFGADYLRIYRFADTARQVAFLRRELGPEVGRGPWLDVPCGQGRHAVALAADGTRMHGLDLSRDLLRAAHDASRQEGVPVAWCRGDLRNLPYPTGEFQVVLCLFNSLGYFAAEADNRRAIAELGRVAAPGGRLVVQVGHPDHARQHPAQARWEKEGVVVESEYAWDEEASRAITRRRAIFRDGTVRHFESLVRLYEPAEFHELLAEVGWQVERELGDYDGGPVSPDSSQRILLCRRQADP